MPRTSRMVLNREALHGLDLAMAKGLESMALHVLEVVDVPDAAPYGEGLVEGGGWLSYVDGKKVAGDPQVKRKPRDFKVRGQGVGVAVGFGFPARFQEMGTVNQPPRPFLTPAVMQVAGDPGFVTNAIRSALGGKLAYMGRKVARSRLRT